MKQGWSCPSWHGSREQTLAGGRARSSAKPSRDGRTCPRCLGCCGVWAEGSAHSLSPGPGQVWLPWSCSAGPCDQVWLEGSVFSHLFFFYSFFPMEYWICHCPNITTSLAGFQHLTVGSVSSGHSAHVWLGLCLKRTGSFKGRALSPSAVNSLWMSLWAFSQRNLSKG